MLDQLVIGNRQVVEMIVAELNRRMCLRSDAQNDIEVKARFLKGNQKRWNG